MGKTIRWALASLALAWGATTPVTAEEEAPRSVEALLAALEDPRYAVRRDAVRALRGRPESALLDRLLRVAREDPHPNVRGFAAEVLATFRDDRVLPALLRMVEEETWPGPRNAAYVALGALGDRRAYDALLSGLEVEGSRAWAAKGLGLLGDVRAFDTLASLYEAHREDVYVRDLVPPALLALDASRGLDVLLVAFAEREGHGRHALEVALRAHPGPRLRRAMLEHLGSEDPALRAAAVRVLAEAGDATCVAPLLDLFGRRPGDRGTVALALMALGAREAAPLLARTLLEAEDAALRRDLARALSGLPEPESLRFLLRALARETDDLARVWLLVALARLGDERAVATIVPLLASEGVTAQPAEISSIWSFPWNVRVRAVALWALCALRDGAAPFPVEDLSSFPRPPPTEWEDRERPAFLRWWEEHGGEDRYRYGE